MSDRDTGRVHLNFEANQNINAFWEWGIVQGELQRKSFCKDSMLPTGHWGQYLLGSSVIRIFGSITDTIFRRGDRKKGSEENVQLQKELKKLGRCQIRDVVI